MEELLDFLHALCGKHNLLVLLIYQIISVLLKLVAHNGIHLGKLHGSGSALHATGKIVAHLVKVCGLSALAGDNKRCTSLVDQYGVDLVDDGVIQISLHELLFVDDHVVTQVVKSKLVVGYIGDVACVSRTTLIVLIAV